jgi:hypothetical protein
MRGRTFDERQACFYTITRGGVWPLSDFLTRKRVPMTDAAHPASEHVTATPGHHAAPPGEQTYFPADEWQSFRDADKTAGAYIVVLMQGIFVIGLILYLIVLWSVV